MSLVRNVDDRSAHRAPDFLIFPDRNGHWCSRKADGLVAGTFFTREAAIRFAKDEGLGIEDMRLVIANDDLPVR